MEGEILVYSFFGQSYLEWGSKTLDYFTESNLRYWASFYYPHLFVKMTVEAYIWDS